MIQKTFYLIGALTLTAAPVFAHGVIGARFFPATLTIDDPFVADEMSLPTVSVLKAPATDTDPATRETDYSVDIAKRLSRDVGVEFGGTYVAQKGEDGSSMEGLDNFSSAVGYQFLRNAAHEATSVLKLDWDMGGTGNRLISDKTSTLTPSVLFGKGLGDIPDSMKYLKPLAITGTLGTAFPMHTADISTDPDTGDKISTVIPKVAEWGFTVQYSLQYLQNNVKDIGLGQPFSRMIPVVEFPLQTPWNGDTKGQTTGTANPGLIWTGRYIQLALEAQIPLNAASGKGVGAIGQIHLYLDDIAPKFFTWTPFSGTLGPTQAN